VKRALAKHALAAENVVYPLLQTKPNGEAAANQLCGVDGEGRRRLAGQVWCEQALIL
jgi:hypothetical protein